MASASGSQALAQPADRAAAAQASASGRAASALADCGLVGPAATRLRADGRSARGHSTSCAGQLSAVAADIRRRAGQIADDQRAWDRAKVAAER